MSLEASVLAFASRGLPVAGELPSNAPPDGSLLPSRLRRGTSVSTRLVADLVRDVAGAADLGGARFVLGSAWGEIETAWTLMKMRHEHDGALSPARFALSVHSAPLSVLGIALGDRAPSTAVAAGPLTFAMALLEGMVACAESTAPVVVVVADETPPRELRPEAPAPAGVALVLTRGHEAGIPIRLDREPTNGGQPTPASAASASVTLLDALRAERPGRVVVGEAAPSRWVVDVATKGAVRV